MISFKHVLIPFVMSVMSWFLAGAMDLTRAEQNVIWPTEMSFVSSKYVLNKCRLVHIATSRSSAGGITEISVKYSSFSEDRAKDCVESTVHSMNIDLGSYLGNISKQLKYFEKKNVIPKVDENLSAHTPRQLFQIFQDYKENERLKKKFKSINGQTHSQLNLVKVPLPRLRISLLGFLLTALVLFWLRGFVGVVRPQ